MKVKDVKQLDLSDLKSDVAYQRCVDERRAKMIANDFNEAAFGSLIVGIRQDGTKWIVDGQTRRRAAELMGMQKVACTTFVSEGREHEANVFKVINHDRRGMPILMVYRACLIAGDKETTDLNALVNKCGFIVPDKHLKSWPSIVAAGTLYKLFRQDDNVLEVSLKLIRKCWHGDDEATAGHVLEGVHYFIRKFKDEYKQARLEKVLKRQRPVLLASDADAGRSLLGGSRGQAIARAIWKHYNHRLIDKLEWA